MNNTGVAGFDYVLKHSTIKELRERAKYLNIRGRWDMTADQLRKEITSAMTKKKEEAYVAEKAKTEAEKKTRQSSKKEPIVWDDVPDKRVLKTADKEERIVNGQKVLMVKQEIKNEFIKCAVKGTAIAFELEDGTVKVGYLLKRSDSAEMLTLEEEKTKQQFVVPFTKILWVRKSGTWPKSIFDIIYGTKPNTMCSK